MSNPIFNIKAVCKNCPINVTEEMRPEICKSSKCKFFTACATCGANTELLAGKCGECGMKAAEENAKINDALSQGEAAATGA